jgi:hypothetical protein
MRALGSINPDVAEPNSDACFAKRVLSFAVSPDSLTNVQQDQHFPLVHIKYEYLLTIITMDHLQYGLGSLI